MRLQAAAGLLVTLAGALGCGGASSASSSSGEPSPGSPTGSGGAGDSTSGSGGGAPKPDPIPSPYEPGDCGLDAPAFCESFEKPGRGGRGGDLDSRLWSFARWGHTTTKPFVRWTSNSDVPSWHPGFGDPSGNTPTFCGQPFSDIRPPNDVRFCEGVDGGGVTSFQANEVFDDGSGFALSSMRIRQAFDFTERTGTLVFDLDAKRPFNTPIYDAHGWWTEVWITADPAPAPYHGAPTVGSYPRSSIGFQILPVTGDCFHDDSCNEASRFVVTKGYEIVREGPADTFQSFKVKDAKLNRFKVLLSKDHMEVWASDYDKPGNLQKVASVDGLDLDFTVGYVSFQHVSYNAPKNEVSPSQTYRWDNLGFDGPAYPVPRSYDVPDEGTPITDESSGEVIATTLGYTIAPQGQPPEPVDVAVDGVDLTNALSATLNLNITIGGGGALDYRFNEGSWHHFEAPMFGDDGSLLRAFSLPAPLEELVNGRNEIHLKVGQDGLNDAVGNIDLTIDAQE